MTAPRREAAAGTHVSQSAPRDCNRNFSSADRLYASLGDKPYYPIDNADSRELLAKYRQLVDSFNAEAASNGGKLIVGGRLGEYRYYDMDKSIAAALAVWL